MSQPSQPIGRRIAGELGSALFCGLLALLVAVVPHLALFAKFGSLEYVGDWDELLYLGVAKAAYLDPSNWQAVDPFSGPDRAPTIYPSALFAPLAHLTRWLGLSAIEMGLVWRLVGGFGLGATLYFLFRRSLSDLRRPILWTLVATLVCLGDSGFEQGRSFVQNTLLASGYVEGSDLHYQDREGFPSSRPNLLGQYRVFNPLLCLPMLLVVAGVLVPGRTPGRGLLILGTLAMGGLVLTNFYMWTSAALAIGLQVLILFVRGYRRPKAESEPKPPAWKSYAIVLFGGLAIGAPQVLMHWWTFSEPEYREIMIRTAKFGRFEWSDPLRWRYLLNFWVWLKLGLGALAILWGRVRRLEFLWLLVLAGFAMSNSVLLLGVDFENTHFHYVYSPFGEILLLVILARLASRWHWEQLALGLVGALALANLTIGTGIRADEAITTPKTVELHEELRSLDSLRPFLEVIPAGATISAPREARMLLMLTPATTLYFSPYTWSSMISDEVLDERHALNAWLQGFDLEGYATLVDQDTERWAHSHYPNETIWPRRRAIFQRIERGDASAWLRRYRTGYLLYPSQAPQPTRGGPWELVAENDSWSLWKRTEESPPGPGHP